MGTSVGMNLGLGLGVLVPPGLVTKGESRVFYTLYLGVHKVHLTVNLTIKNGCITSLFYRNGRTQVNMKEGSLKCA